LGTEWVLRPSNEARMGETASVGHRLLELAGILLTNETLDGALGRVADITVRTSPACDAAGVSVLALPGGDPDRRGATEPTVERRHPLAEIPSLGRR
jgi:FAD/FMN-containing dehydrogenase